MHRVILASASKYLLKVFSKHNVKKLQKVAIPEPFPTDSGKGLGKVSDDPVLKILKYIYSNQNIYKIKDEITDANLFSLYSQAYALEMTKLLKDLTELTKTELLNQDNCVVFYVDAIKFKNKELVKACENLMVTKFTDIQEEASEHLLKLPTEYFVALCSSDDLHLEHEN